MRRPAVLALGLASIAGCGSLLGLNGDDEDSEVLKQGPGGDAQANDGTTGVDDDGSSTTNVTDDAGDGGDAGKDAVAPAPRRRAVFATQKTMNGAFGGIDEGDTVCRNEAADAGLDGSFVVWLSTDNVGAKSRLVTDAGWYLLGPDAAPVFTGPSAIVNGSFPQTAITRDAKGQNVTGQAWTGTRQDGTTYDSDCAGWSDTGATGVPGVLGAKDETWTGAAPTFCSESKRLLCFEK